MYMSQVLVLALTVVAASAQGGYGGHGHGLGLIGGLGGGLGGEGGGYHGGHYTGKSYAVFHGPVEGPVHQVHGTVADKHGKHIEFVDYVAHPKYKYEYGVEDHHTGDNHGQAEVRDGDKVEGVYSLKEPGGNLRTVKYVADHKGGFLATVENHGGNDHSGYKHGKAHSYINFHGPVVGEAHPVSVGHGHGHYGY